MKRTSLFILIGSLMLAVLLLVGCPDKKDDGSNGLTDPDTETPISETAPTDPTPVKETPEPTPTSPQTTSAAPTPTESTTPAPTPTTSQPSTPTPTSTPNTTATPSPIPTATPTSPPVHTPTPTPIPTNPPTPTPTAIPTMPPTPAPTAIPTATPTPPMWETVYQRNNAIACCKTNCGWWVAPDCVNSSTRTITGIQITNAYAIRVEGYASYPTAQSCYADGLITATFSNGTSKSVSIPCNSGTGFDMLFSFATPQTGQLTITLKVGDWCTKLHWVTVTQKLH